jgi:hypothetical protein
MGRSSTARFGAGSSIMKSFCAGLTALLLLVSCGTARQVPAGANATGPYLATRFCGFNFDGRTKEAKLTLDLSVLRALPAGAFVETTFDNPLEPAKPLTSTYRAQGTERELRLLSPPVKGIEPREYGITVRVYASPEKTALLATHHETCRSPVSQREFGTEYQ